MLGAFVVGKRLALRKKQNQNSEKKWRGKELEISVGGKDTENHKLTVSVMPGNVDSVTS